MRDHIVCPLCKSSKDSIDLRNVGFVNCEWVLKGKLLNKDDSRVFAEGRTYDGKLYTFKETNYQAAYEFLDILVKPLKEGNILNDSKVYSESSYRSSSVSQSQKLKEQVNKGDQKIKN